MFMDKENLIIEAAVKLFQEKGFASTTISAVAKEAAIGKGTVYGYFKSKEELILRACLYNCDKDGAAIEQFMTTQSFSNPVKRIYNFLDILLSKFLTKGADEHKLFNELSVLVAEDAELKRQAREAISQKLRQWRAMTLADYQLGLDSGHFRYYEEPSFIGEFLVATINGLIWESQWNEEDFLEGQAHRIASAYCQMLLKEPARLAEYLK